VNSLGGAIIAAGHGERLRGSGVDQAKPLVELAGHPLLVRQTRLMLSAGASSVLAVINSATARLIDRQILALPEELSLLVRDTSNSMESLLALGERLAPGWFLLATVDAAMPQAEFSGFARRACAMVGPKRGAPLDGVIAVVPWRGDRRPLFARISPQGLISPLGGEQGSLVTAGVYLFSTGIFEFAEEARRAGLDAMRRYLGHLIARDMSFGAIELSSVVDIDEAADLELARRLAESWR